MELFDVLKNFGIPAVGALAGFLASASHYKFRLEQVEKDFSKFKEDHKELHKKELDDFKEKIEEFREAGEKFQKSCAAQFEELAKEIDGIDKAFARFERASGMDFAKDAELARFIEEQNKQWQAIHRLLGQIEGTLRGQKRWSSPPPPQLSSR